MHSCRHINPGPARFECLSYLTNPVQVLELVLMIKWYKSCVLNKAHIQTTEYMNCISIAFHYKTHIFLYGCKSVNQVLRLMFDTSVAFIFYNDLKFGKVLKLHNTQWSVLSYWRALIKFSQGAPQPCVKQMGSSFFFFWLALFVLQVSGEVHCWL